MSIPRIHCSKTIKPYGPWEGALCRCWMDSELWQHKRWWGWCGSPLLCRWSKVKHLLCNIDQTKNLAGGQAKDDQTPEPPHQNSSASTRTRPPGSAHLGHHHIPATRTHGTHYRESKGDKQLFKQVAWPRYPSGWSAMVSSALIYQWKLLLLLKVHCCIHSFRPYFLLNINNYRYNVCVGTQINAVYLYCTENAMPVFSSWWW